MILTTVPSKLYGGVDVKYHTDLEGFWLWRRKWSAVCVKKFGWTSYYVRESEIVAGPYHTHTHTIDPKQWEK